MFKTILQKSFLVLIVISGMALTSCYAASSQYDNYSDTKEQAYNYKKKHDGNYYYSPYSYRYPYEYRFDRKHYYKGRYYRDKYYRNKRHYYRRHYRRPYDGNRYNRPYRSRPYGRRHRHHRH